MPRRALFVLDQMEPMPRVGECKGDVCHGCDQRLPKRPLQIRPDLPGMENTWIFEDTLRLTQILHANKWLQEVVPGGIAAANLSPRPVRRCEGSVVGGLLVDECDDLSALLIHRQP